ncbi:MAG TPA: hypothetical protein VLQ89_07465 [Candidatus Binatia bacterium]|nr:hypothetical protein [Candidatus Binatia bacterium]
MKRNVIAAGVLLLGLALGASESQVPRFGIGVRMASFGVPNALLDLFLYEHPQISGTAYAFEAHSFGDKGPRSVFSGVYCLEFSRLAGSGFARIEQYNNRLFGAGEVTQLSFTATILLHVFPSSPIHPYIGGGIGISRISIFAEGSYMDELGTTIRKTVLEKLFLPVGHIPVGFIANFSDKLILRGEAGFKNGFYFGGSLVFTI